MFYEKLDADSAVEAGQVDEADVLVVDPPRRGLNEGVLKMLIAAEKPLPAGGC